MGIDGNRLESMGIDCSVVDFLMLAAGFGSVLVAGLGSAGITSTLVTALHVGLERLLAGFDASSVISHARAVEASADFKARMQCTVLIAFFKIYATYFACAVCMVANFKSIFFKSNNKSFIT